MSSTARPYIQYHNVAKHIVYSVSFPSFCFVFCFFRCSFFDPRFGDIFHTSGHTSHSTSNVYQPSCFAFRIAGLAGEGHTYCICLCPVSVVPSRRRKIRSWIVMCSHTHTHTHTYTRLPNSDGSTSAKELILPKHIYPAGARTIPYCIGLYIIVCCIQ